MRWLLTIHGSSPKLRPTILCSSGKAFAASSLLSRLLRGAFTVLALAGVCHAADGPAARPVNKAQVQSNYGRTPLSFEANRGQTDARVQFFSRGEGYGLFLTPGEAVLQLERSRPQDGKPAVMSTLRMGLAGANTAAAVAGQEPLPGVVNYFRGSDPSKWTANVQTFSRVSYTGVYPGIDLVYYGNQRQLEYDFVVAPGADAKKIALNFSGATPSLDADGNLVLVDRENSTSFHKPVVYQMTGATRVAVAGAYELKGQQVHFTLGAYDHSKPLVIDPVLSYGTFLGGNLDDRGFAIQADAAGNAYIAGDTVSLNFPLMNPIQSTNHNGSNGWVVFVTKLNPAGSAVIYSTFLGGVADSHALGLAIDSTGSAYVAGYTSAGDFPVTAGAFQVVCGGGASNINGVHARVNSCGPSGDTNGFISKLSPAGNSLTYSTYLGGSSFSQVTGIAVNAAGEAYVTGDTNANCGPGPYWTTNHAYPDTWTCFPTTSGAYQTLLNGAVLPGSNIWAFFTKLSADGASLVYSTQFLAPKGTAPSGGSLSNTAFGVAVDSAGNGYIVGNAGYGLPTTPGAYYVPPANTSTILPPYAAFVAKFNPAVSGTASLVYSTFLGSAAQTANASNYTNTATSVAVDASGDAVVAGSTNVCGYPTTTGAFLTSPKTGGGCQDGFVTKLNPTGTGLIWSTLLGSNTTAASNTSLTNLALGSSGNIYVTGTVQGNTFPLVGALHSAPNSGGSILAELNSTGSSLIFSTYLGGFGTSGYSGGDYGTGVATDTNGNMYVTGRQDPNLLSIPTTTGALQTTYQGGPYDAFVVKVAPFATSTTALAISANPATVGQSVTFTATVSGPAGSSVPTGTVTFLSGSSSLGTGTLDATGKATFATSSLSATSYTVTAQYSGDSSFTSSASAAQTLVVNPIATTTTLTVTPSTAVAGTSVSMIAMVTPASGTGIPTGTITFKNGTTQLAAIAVNASGTATFTSTTLAAGTYSITAAYSGDSSNASSLSASSGLTLTPVVSTTTTLAATATTAQTGVSITFTATITPSAGTGVPTGTVTFLDGITTLGTGTLAAGKATFSTAALAVGTHSITASYGGDPNDLASVSSALAVVITGPPNITLTASPTRATISAGGSVTTQISVTPGNGFTGTTTFACSGLPAFTSCTFNPASVATTGGVATTTLTIATNVATGAMTPGPPQQRDAARQIAIAGAGVLMALLLLPGITARKRKAGRLQWLAVALLMIGAATVVSGCGSSNTNVTPTGVSTVVITATSGSVSNTVNFQLTVQ